MEPRAIFFDLGDTLGEAKLTGEPKRLKEFIVYPFVRNVLETLKSEGNHLGIISNTGDDAGSEVDSLLDKTGILEFFDSNLRIYSKDVNLTKNSKEIFVLAAERAGLVNHPEFCLYVGEAAHERAYAIEAGFVACPHPLLARDVLNEHALWYARIVAPDSPETSDADWREALTELPLVPLHVAGVGGTVVYAITTSEVLDSLAHAADGPLASLNVDVLGTADLPKRTDLFILRDDAAAGSGFLSPRGEAAELFIAPSPAKPPLAIKATAEGIVVALPPDQSLEELHFSQTRHGHTLKLLPDPALLKVARKAPIGFATGHFKAVVPTLPDEIAQELGKIQGPVLLDRIERYSNKKPPGSGADKNIESRHVDHPDNKRAVTALAAEFEKLGSGRMDVSFHQFTHRGQTLHNVEAELRGESEELVLVTAHLDSTAANKKPYHAAQHPAPGADDDASGVAAVLTLAERILAITAGARPARTIRFVLFNAEEEGLVGSRAYARLQHALGAQIIAVFQMDMIGFNRQAPNSWELHAGFSPSRAVEEQSEALAELVRIMASQVSPDLARAQLYPKDEPSGGDPADGRSDHTSFNEHGYAACCASEDLFAGPLGAPAEMNEYYHQPDDVSENINPNYAADITRAVGAAISMVSSGRSDTAFTTAFLSRPPSLIPTPEAEEFDVAVVGAGISGVHAAWQLREFGHLSPSLSELAQRHPDRRLRVVLFEQSTRVGGRLYSQVLPGTPVNRPVELGGMRYLNSHKLVNSLVAEFGLESRTLPVDDSKKRHLFYLRGQHFTGADWDRPSFVPPYRLDRNERVRSPGQLLIEVALRHQARVAAEPERYRNTGFWNLLLDELSEEAFLLVRDAGGYETIVSNWSAADAIPFLLADFAPGAKYLALNRGFQSLPLEIERRFRDECGGETRMGHRLHRVDRHAEKGLQLVFDVNTQGNFSTFRRARNPHICHARHVILALPRRAIELMHPESFIFDPAIYNDEPTNRLRGTRNFEEDLRSVLPQPGFKIFAAYRQPWWQKTRWVRTGRSVTDLPVRQCYYWHTTSNPQTGSILMASYNDGSSVEYWAGLARDPTRYQPPVAAALPGVPVFDITHPSVAGASLVRELQDQLRELHGLSDTDMLMPYAVVAQDWTQDPFGGGWHFWKIGERSSQVMQRMRKPFTNVPLYICGEAWSSQQGWVEGALETAEVILLQHFGLPPLVDRLTGAKAVAELV
ncbi:hypothetical protein DC522_30755 [Microvirga sp. KLBC 81]|uniref:M20/M25/M40 family metallo-hydrolase n=1 Tax=Microvirga sp. KLBC 81 TaxID=1862707 RepID=UPI000D519D94|nr:M20/M25/M40 family metallo-hydrolase [Microvirga sp. KLBC 81]PVE20699.1 hypothetical protein DC522_30755 [Microvirga sp. KLBC 81]